MNRNLFLRGLLWMACMGAAWQSQAQYNKTFTDSGQHSVDIVDATDASGTPYSCLLSTSNAYPIILHKTDFSGITAGVDMAYALNRSGLVLTPTQLLFTPNEEYLVVGTLRYPSLQNNIFAARFDGSGNLMWFREYPTLSTNSEVHICLVEDDPSVPESYIMVYGHQAPTTPPAIYNNCIQATRINAGGIPMWTYRYKPPASPILPLTNYLTDYPETIVFADPSDGAARYYIGGTSILQAGSGGSFRYGFAMTISNAGAINDAYQQLPVYGLRNQHAIFDGSTNQVVIAYTTTNTLLPISSGSMIGVSRFSTSGPLSLVQNDFYAHSTGTESAGYGIRRDRSGNHYIVACEVYHPNPAPAPGASACVAMLKLNKAIPSVPVFFNEYNYLTQTRNTDIIQSYDGTNETYTMAVSRYLAPYGSRLVSTDASGTVCGSRPVPFTYTSASYAPKSGVYTSTPQSLPPAFQGMSPVTLSSSTDCNPLFPDTYKLLPLAQQDETRISIYPNLLRQEQALSLDCTMPEAITVQVSICAMDGRVLSRQNLAAAAGNNHLSADVSMLSTGNYLLTVQGSHNTAPQTFRLSRL